MLNLKFKSLAAASLIMLAPNAFAMNLFRDPYLGIAAIQTNQRFETNFGDPVFKKNPQDYSVFAGFKFTKYFGIEGGYEWQPSKSKTTVITAGQSTPGGNILPAGAFDTVNSSFKGTLPYVGLFAEYDQKCPWVFCWIKWQALVGASFTHFIGKTQVSAVDGVPFAGRLFYYDKSKAVVLVKLASTGFVTRNLGVRLFVDYRNTSTVNMQANFTPGLIKMKDTWGVGLGLLWQFC